MSRCCLLGLALAVVLTASCSPARDSGDLTIDLPTWTLSAEPMETLGDDGTADRMFSGIQVARLPDRQLLVAERGTKELRLFRDGVLTARLSRDGDGPGELRDLSRITVSGDTIVVIPLPMVSREVSTFTGAGGFVSRRRLRAPAGGPAVTPIALLASGEFLVEEGRGVRAFNEVPPLGVLMPDSVTLGLLRQPASDSTGVYRPLGRFVRGAMVAHRIEGAPIPFSMARVSLAPSSAWAASGGLVWIADAATGALRAFDGTGEPVVSATLPVRPRPLDAAAIEQSRDRALASARTGIDSAAALASHDPVLLPPTLPILDGVVAGHDGEVWVRLFQLEAGPTSEYLVVDRAGQAVATMAVPTDLTIHQVGADFVLGVRRDADGVETVVEYRLQRGGR